jgi:hypothetical protein
MKIPRFIRRVRPPWEGVGRRMQRPSVVSNGTKVREDETEVLACSQEVALCLPLDWGAAPTILPSAFEPSLHISGNATLIGS